MDARRLREATAPEHEATEELMPVMRADLTRAQYAAVLRAFYPVIAGWEAWAREHAPAEHAALAAERKRGPMLEQDLQALGEPLPAVRAFPAPESFRTPAGFLGAMYVVEGSTLGGQHIARHVEPLLGLTSEAGGTAFFRGYGEETGARWRGFVARIAAVPEEDGEETIAAARAMFAIFREAILPLSQQNAA